VSLPPAAKGFCYRDTTLAASATWQLALLELVGEGEVLPHHTKACCAAKACVVYVTPALLSQHMIFFSFLALVCSLAGKKKKKFRKNNLQTLLKVFQ